MELLKLNDIFSKRPEELTAHDADTYEERARQWGRDFIGTYHTTNDTPYIHVMKNHVLVHASTWQHSAIHSTRLGEVQRCNQVVFPLY